MHCFDRTGWEKLRVIKRGYELLEVAPRAENNRGDLSLVFAQPLRIVLKAASEPLRIEGVVFDDSGRPLAGALVKRLDGQIIGNLENPRVAPNGRYGRVELETLLLGLESNSGSRTDGLGHFFVDGLVDGDYRLRVLDRRTMHVQDTDPIPAGSRGVRIDMSAESSYARVAGRVIDTEKTPIAHAEVFLYRIVQDRVLDHDAVEDTYMEGERVRCDAEGRFELRNVSRSVAMLSALTPGANRITNVDLASQADVEHLEIVVPRAAHVQIDASGSKLKVATAMFVDAKDGAGVWTTAFEDEKGGAAFDSLHLIEGRSAAVAVPLNATEVVLYGPPHEDGHTDELARIPLHLKAGELTIVKWP
ncbi:MAG TPA: hypothetical protein VK843_10645 [Planctomycetota bacterium]|nr:hypothetical protein [Planctomycetota bacterium]